MKLFSANRRPAPRTLAFTLPELMVAMAVGLLFAGTIMLLLIQAALENQRGFADATIEQKAYTLQSTIAQCLRSMSKDMGISPDYTTGLYDTNGDLLGYETIYMFHSNSDGSYTTERISFTPGSGAVIYTPDLSATNQFVVWMTNSPTAVLRQLCFSTSLNLDGSLDGSLVNVRFEMDDNGSSPQYAVNDPASILRDFSVQMRSD